jgi:hypothetical protein
VTGEADVAQDFREGWRGVPTRGLYDHLVTWLAASEMEASGLGLVAGGLERHDGVGLGLADQKRGQEARELRERILARHRPRATLLMAERSTTCGKVADGLESGGRADLARQVELWAVASLRPNHLPAQAGEVERLFQWD